MKKIAVYGAGGFGREVACMLRHINNITPTWDLVGFLTMEKSPVMKQDMEKFWEDYKS